MDHSSREPFNMVDQATVDQIIMIFVTKEKCYLSTPKVFLLSIWVGLICLGILLNIKRPWGLKFLIFKVLTFSPMGLMSPSVKEKMIRIVLF